LATCAQQGYDTILSNGYYLDLSQPASQHYAVDPLPPGNPLTPAQKNHVLGGEACMWSELVSAETVDSRLWPRALAVAERLWSPSTVVDVDDFYRRMEVESVRLEELGLTHRSNYLPMIERLAGGLDPKALKVLADVVEPVKNYLRHHSRVYTSDFPLDRLVDAVRCESGTARSFRQSVDKCLAQAPAVGDYAGLVKTLKTWEKNHSLLAPILEKSDKLIEVGPQSQGLSEAAKVGLEAIGYLRSGKAAPPAWQEKAGQILDRAQEFHAELQIAVIPAIRKLVLAAGQIDKLKGMSGTDWNKSLDDQVAAKNPKGWN
jgi:hexosaminidase